MGNTINKIKFCNTVEELKVLMKNEKVIRENKFPENIFYLKRTPSRFVKYEINFDNELLNYAVKIFLYIKFSSLCNFIPQNSGEHSYCCSLKAFFLNLDKVLKKEFKVFDEITIEQIEKTFLLYLTNTDAKNIKSFFNHTNKIKEYIMWQEYLPDFLKFNVHVKEYIFENKFLSLWDKDREVNVNIDSIDGEKNLLRKNLEGIGFFNEKGNYPIENMTKIIVNCKNYIDTYKEECLSLLKLIIDSRKQKGPYTQAKYINDYFASSSENNITFINELLNIYSKVVKKRNLYKYKNGKYIGKNINIEFTKLIEILDLVEASCVCIIMLGSAMRVGELLELKKDYRVLDSEFPNLVRIIYKTAATDEGEEYANPIPIICLDCLNILKQIAYLKDEENKFDKLLLSSIYSSDARVADSGRVNSLIKKISKYSGLETAPTSHQFRHSMAYLVASSNNKDGIELASTLLGHKSTRMTIQYLSQFNLDLQNLIKEQYNSKANEIIDFIVDKISEEEHFFGVNAKYFNPNTKFVGKQAAKFALSIKNNLRKLVQDNKFMIIQADHCLCIHDLSNPQSMKCHRGYDFYNSSNMMPITTNCRSNECSNAIFTESNVEKLKELYGHIVDDEVRSRLEKNTYFLKSGGIDAIKPYSKIIKEYDEYKKEKVN